MKVTTVNYEFRSQIRDKILDDPHFESAVFSGSRPQTTPRWVKVTVKPVLLKDGTRLQFEYFDSLKGIAKNYAYSDAGPVLDEVLRLPFRHYYVRSVEHGFQVQITKRGKVLLREHATPQGVIASDHSHDRKKRRPLDATKHNHLLRAIGLMTEDGDIKPTMQAKFRQINEFLRLVDSRIAPALSAATSIRVVDFGCGNAYLTFALHDYLARSTTLQPAVTGVDSDAMAIERHRQTCANLGLAGLTFEVGNIAGYEADPPPDVVVALHACDTATDEALAKAIRWQAKNVFCVPCCHHHLQVQLDARRVTPSIQPLLRFGILKERLGDILTDALRALILGIAGYHVDIVQFVSPEHTSKNLMLIASSQEATAGVDMVRQYKALRDSFHVVPHMETLLADVLDPFLSADDGKRRPDA